MEKINVGIVGTGLIAGVMARSMVESPRVRFAAVSSRRRENAEAFGVQFPGVTAVAGVDALLQMDSLDAVYVATPTATKEAIVLAALAAGKHVLVDKPFASMASAQRMIDAAADDGLVLLDATHFVHHPRTAAIRAGAAQLAGDSRLLNTAFHTAIPDRSNIRFDTALEPMGALGDLGWYAMRAIVEYLQPAGPIRKVAAVAERDGNTDAVLRAAGLLEFDSGEFSTFDVGYAVNTTVMDLRLIGDRGVITMDDFPLDWTNSIAHQNSDVATGYWYRKDKAAGRDALFVETPSDTPAHILMLDHFAERTQANDAGIDTRTTEALQKTQYCLDAVWAALVESAPGTGGKLWL